MTTNIGAVRLLATLTLVASGLTTTGALAQVGKPADKPATKPADKPATTPQAGKSADKPARPAGSATQPALPTGSTVTATPKIDPAKEKSIRELLEVTGEARRLGGVISEQILTYFQRNAPGGIPADKTAGIKARFTDVSELTTGLIEAYDKRYTADEITALLAFYRTPVGKKVSEQSLSLAEDLTRIGRTWGTTRAQAIGEELQKAQAGAAPPQTAPPVLATFDKKPFKSSGKVVKTASGLQYDDMTVGTGKVAVAGKTCVMHYTGTLTDGKVFDSSRERGQPFPFVLSTGNVIQGWHEGVAGMKVGGRRKLIIPAALGYGTNGNGSIPPNATLIFDVELMDVQ